MGRVGWLRRPAAPDPSARNHGKTVIKTQVDRLHVSCHTLFYV